MIIARADTGDGKPMLIFGLSDGNIKRLTDGDPIAMTDKTHPGVPEGWVIVIMHGNTEKDIYKMLKKGGLIDSDTKVVADPRLGIDSST